MYLSKRVVPEVVYTLAQPTGVADSFYFQAPNYPTRFSHMDCSVTAADSTDKVTPSLVVAGTTIATGAAAIAAPDVVQRTSAVDAGKSEIIPANAVLRIVLTFGGTAANVTGIQCRVVLHGTN